MNDTKLKEIEEQLETIYDELTIFKGRYIDELLHGAETAKENERLVERQRLTYEDYCSLYAVCQKLLKRYKNHRNTKAGFEELEREMELRMPCPF